MKKLFTVLILFISFCSFGQIVSVDINKNFTKRRDAFEDFYKNHSKGKGTGFKVYKRWEDFVQKRLDTNGLIINNTAMAFEGYKQMEKRGEVNSSRTNGYWYELGPDEWTNNPDPYPATSQGGWNPGNGRINEIAIDPNNQSTIYAGASGGGLWKTTDGGTTWSVLTDGMPNLAVSGIVISYADSDKIFLLTGDYDSKDLVSIGVLVSDDGGSTWNQSGLTFGRDEVIYGSELRMNYIYNSQIIATTSNGIYLTLDYGVTWDLVQAGTFFDVEYNPSNPDTVYASTDVKIYRSVDGGQNWVEMEDLSGFAAENSRIELAVTEDNPDKVYAILGDWDQYLGTFISDDRGTTWVRHYNAAGPNILSSSIDGTGTSAQSPFDLCIEVSPVNENEIIIGGVNIWKSTDGGNNWKRKTYWREDKTDEQYVHADIHELIYNGTRLYAGADGGFFRSLDYGETWTDLSEGLIIMQPHKIGITNSNTNLVYLGTQDNGINKYSGSANFENVRGADGFECHIWPYNSDTVFTSRQYGLIERSVDGGATFSYVIYENPSTNNKIFNNPFILRAHPTEGRLIVSDASEVQIKNLGGGAFFTKHVADDELHFISNMDMSSSNNDLLIASLVGRDDDTEVSVDSIWMTTTLLQAVSNSWSNITSNLPTSMWGVSDVAIDPSDPNHFIVSFCGYDDGNKVFETWNSGTNWINTSYNLENVPINCITIDPDIPNSVYIGTDLGVFYKEPGEEQWIYYSNGLPPVIVHELEINTVSNYIYAATFGRGLWRSSLYQDCVSSYNLTPDNDPSQVNYTGIQHYEASEYINSTRQVQGGFGTDVHYQAGSYIDLKPGFCVYEGNTFKSVIGDCGEIIDAPAKPKSTKVTSESEENK